MMVVLLEEILDYEEKAPLGWWGNIGLKQNSQAGTYHLLLFMNDHPFGIVPLKSDMNREDRQMTKDPKYLQQLCLGQVCSYSIQHRTIRAEISMIHSNPPRHGLTLHPHNP